MDENVARHDPSSRGQVVEWLVWARLASTSGGDLHMFLPLVDRGIDGIVHRISTDAYVPVQVKGLTCTRPNTIHVKVLEDELADDRSLVIAVAIEPDGGAVSDWTLVVPAPVFTAMSRRYHYSSGVVVHEARVRLLNPVGTRWEPWCVPASQLAEWVAPPISHTIAAAVVPAFDVGEAQCVRHRRPVSDAGQSPVPPVRST